MTSILKAFADFLQPIGLVWLALSVLTLLAVRRRQWRSVLLPGSAWLLLTLTSASPLSHHLLGTLESQWPPLDMTQLPECDAIIVLGGGMEPSQHEPAGIHLTGGSDRLFTGLKLGKLGKGRLIVVSGGSFETPTAIVSEADGAKLWVEQWQLSQVPVQSLGRCLDTHDEAVKVSALAAKEGWKRVALVTSAFHMTRSKAVFEKAGAVVVPVPCNYLSALMRDRRVRWLVVPNASYLANFEVWLHESIGMWAYRICGWI